ncbi:hypothetical protein O181_107023 [Austropuccinia psidii MF-1]|uniref:Uncharacterized protein n=1 Tax=Austropuccinia psidii MF-1 TaxID=1389203 RepID=A0A9Q3JQ20_9BASI|nr:hypothetical protein [Austropuccinia psidii MF-1]
MRSLKGHLQSHPGGIQQCIAAQRVPDPCISLEKLHEFLLDFEKIPGPYQHLQVTQWMASIDGKEKHDSFNRRMEEKNPPPPNQLPRTAPVASRRKSNVKKQTLQPGLQNPKDSAGFHGKCVSDGKNNDGVTGKGGRQTKI